MIGRATRNAHGKHNAIVLDFAGNIARHGPVDDIEGPSKTPGKGQAPLKVCGHCQSYNHIAARECVDCGAAFEIAESPSKLEATASALPVLSGRADPLDWRQVDGTSFTRHTKFGAPDAPATMRVTHHCGRKSFSEFICFEHPNGSYPRRKAENWWRARSGDAPAPATVAEAVDRAESGEIGRVKAIRVAKEDGYDRIVAHRMADGSRDPLEAVLHEAMA